MDNPVTFSDITLLNTLATCANMTTDEVFKDFKIMANKKILKNHNCLLYTSNKINGTPTTLEIKLYYPTYYLHNNSKPFRTTTIEYNKKE